MKDADNGWLSCLMTTRPPTSCWRRAKEDWPTLLIDKNMYDEQNSVMQHVRRIYLESRGDCDGSLLRSLLRVSIIMVNLKCEVEERF